MNNTRQVILIAVLSISLIGLIDVSHGLFAEGKYELKEMTPEVKTALENRKERFEKLRVFKRDGVVGENNRGYVEVLNSDSDARSLAERENQDRKIIYQAIEEQNHLSNAMETIGKVFAQVQRDKAAPGEKIQAEDGSWVTK